jgi:hypothetical protein
MEVRNLASLPRIRGILALAKADPPVIPVAVPGGAEEDARGARPANAQRSAPRHQHRSGDLPASVNRRLSPVNRRSCSIGMTLSEESPACCCPV